MSFERWRAVRRALAAGIIVLGCREALMVEEGLPSPAQLRATALSPRIVRVEWSPVSREDVSGYRLERRKNFAPQFEVVRENMAVSAGTTVLDDALEPDAVYGYRVFAVGRLGNLSAPSTVTGARTPPPPSLLVRARSTLPSAAAEDLDGYQVVVKGLRDTTYSTSFAVAPNGEKVLAPLKAGRYSVVLRGLAPQCAVGGDSERIADVRDDGLATVDTVSFEVDCRDPTRGRLVANVVVLGRSVDTSFSIAVSGTVKRSPQPDSAVARSRVLVVPAGTPEGRAADFDDLLPAEYEVRLDSVAPNCAVDGERVHLVTVRPLGVDTTTYRVRCTKVAGPSTEGRPFKWKNALSAASAVTGQTLTLAMSLDVTSDTTAKIAGAQGILRYDPRVMRYRGKTPRDFSGVTVNATGDSQGQIIFAATSLEAEAFGGVVQVAQFSFEVVGAGLTGTETTLSSIQTRSASGAIGQLDTASVHIIEADLAATAAGTGGAGGGGGGGGGGSTTRYGYSSAWSAGSADTVELTLRIDMKGAPGNADNNGAAADHLSAITVDVQYDNVKLQPATGAAAASSLNAALTSVAYTPAQSANRIRLALSGAAGAVTSGNVALAKVKFVYRAGQSGAFSHTSTIVDAKGPSALDIKARVDVTDTPYAGTGGGGGGGRDPLRHAYSSAWAAGTGDTLELTMRINMGTAPGNADNNGAGPDQLSGITVDVSYDNAKLEPVTGSVASQALNPDLTSRTYNPNLTASSVRIAILSLEGNVTSGDVALAKIKFRYRAGQSGGFTHRSTITQASGPMPGLINLVPRIDVTDTPFAGVGGGGGSNTSRYGYTATWAAGTADTVVLTARIDLGAAPGNDDNNGAGADQLSAITFDVQYDNVKLQPATGSAAAASLNPTLTTATYNSALAVNKVRLALSAAAGAVTSGNVALAQIKFVYRTGQSGAIAHTSTIVEAKGPPPALASQVSRIDVVDTPFAGTGGAPSDPLRHAYTSSWAAGTADTVELTMRINLGVAPGNADNNGAGADQLSGITVDVQYDSVKLQPATGAAASQALNPELNSRAYNPNLTASSVRIAIFSLEGNVTSGNVALAKLKFVYRAGQSGGFTHTSTITQASGPSPGLINLVPRIDVTDTPFAGVGGGGGGGSNTSRYGYAATWAAGAADTVVLTARIDLGAAPGNDDNNGAGADQLSAITFDVQYDNVKLQPATGSAAAASLNPTLTTATYNSALAVNKVRLALSAAAGAVTSGNVALAQIKFVYRTGQSGAIAHTSTIVEAKGPPPALASQVSRIDVADTPFAGFAPPPPPSPPGATPFIWSTTFSAPDADRIVAMTIKLDLSTDIPETVGAETLAAWAVEEIRVDTAVAKLYSFNFGGFTQNASRDLSQENAGRYRFSGTAVSPNNSGVVTIATLRFRLTSASGRSLTTATTLGNITGPSSTGFFSYRSRIRVQEGTVTSP